MNPLPILSTPCASSPDDPHASKPCPGCTSRNLGEDPGHSRCQSRAAASSRTAPSSLASASPVQFDARLLGRYDVNGPRYTSYPTALQFHDDFGVGDYARAAAQSKRTGKPVSLYLHVPFCDTVCFYCACTKIVTNNRSHAEAYVARLHAELARQASLLGAGRTLAQMHWGGGTPTFLSLEQIASLVDAISRHFVMTPDDSAEYAIEIDPRSAGPASIRALRALGFNRLSIGVQDFDPRVQEAIHRVQPRALVEATLDAARSCGFKSVNFDLIYGLPHQTTASFSNTLDAVIEMAPERLSVFSYAHLPEQFKMQRCLPDALPDGPEKLALLQTIIARLTAAGYVYIGMDHFARPDDELALAQAAGTLHRNFQGYSTRADCDLIGVGMSAIGRVGDSYAQNAKTLKTYYDAIDAGGLAIARGVQLDRDDHIRRDVISRLMCHMALDFSAIEDAHDIDFVAYFASELGELADLAADGLVAIDAHGLRVLPAGRLLVRVVAQVFDGYRRSAANARCAKVM
ncbi:oxygen-independent coproporphyrinogen III oxidase [Pandoraea sputorum]|uniref:Oxygen-independent coproporphyrinogen III oxidase n=1 Tax=Pandoraea sputorum TaxID=93222 RepID=A0A239S6Y0_9BURK|nr:oxygen-independent coproporphyrinogen III oxidase [Pandoraea sputorum]SNU80952.1 Oxygen-independent coproporphyrinogen-III oxidase [Pandoraea sputorum]VVD73050.1 oxygen-independent coproporphyrinogen III oxidase [Pandoraea sputorum]